MAMDSPVLGRLIRVALSHKQRFFWTNAVMVGAAVGTAALPTLIGWIINSGLGLEVGLSNTAASWRLLSMMCGLLFVAAIARGALAYGQAYLGESLSQRVAYDLRNRLYDHLQQLSFGFHDKSQVGEIMQRATQDIEGIRMFLQMGVTRLVFIGLLILFSVALIALENIRVGFVVIALVPIIGIYAGVMSLRMRPIWLGIVQMQGQLGIVLQENLVGQRVVKAFSRQEFEQSKFDEKVD
ncbi:MAG TPA: ABC transporter ATP-binding protein, partial [Dehalococcoidia bacterium]|nr:ABC transporter ATP-binding protein [Dehalococcoidia bacterium]